MDSDSKYGSVIISSDSATISATQDQLNAWATRPGERWPCSVLRDCDRITAVFDSGGLVDLVNAPQDLPSDEFNAWSSDVLRSALPTDHPAYFVAVGQFEADNEQTTPGQRTDHSL